MTKVLLGCLIDSTLSQVGLSCYSWLRPAALWSLGRLWWRKSYHCNHLFKEDLTNNGFLAFIQVDFLPLHKRTLSARFWVGSAWMSVWSEQRGDPQNDPTKYVGVGRPCETVLRSAADALALADRSFRLRTARVLLHLFTSLTTSSTSSMKRSVLQKGSEDAALAGRRSSLSCLPILGLT